MSAKSPAKSLAESLGETFRAYHAHHSLAARHAYIYRVSQNVCAPINEQIERKLVNKNDLSIIGPR